MEFDEKRPKTNLTGRRHLTVKAANGICDHFSLPMNLYAVPPDGKLDLSRAEQLVEERIRLLRVFDTKNTLTGKDWNQDWEESVKALLHSVPGTDGQDNFYVRANQRQKITHLSGRIDDHVSHFLLRLYCSRSQELKDWFVWHEVKFLQFQLLDNQNKGDLERCLELYNFPFDPVKGTDRETLMKLPYFGKLPFSHSIRIYSSDFKKAMSVIRTRKCVMIEGTAYVLLDDMVGMVCQLYKINLKEMLARMTQRLPRLQEDDRLIPIIGSVHHELVVKAEKRAEDDARLKNRAKVTPQMVNTLAVESFPPCMRKMHEALRHDHHLKHYGRIYYGLFLKSIGMTVDDAIEFFREEFVRKVTPEKFAKEYSYNIRYNYGLEGAKKNLSAYGCQKIINQNAPAAGDSHGCPFKHSDITNLKKMLRRYGVDDDTMTQIEADVVAKDYTGGCTKFFKCKHPNATIRAENGEIYHPNQYFAESRRALSGFVDPIPMEETATAEPMAGDGEQKAEERDVEQFYDDEGEMEAIDAAIAASEQRDALSQTGGQKEADSCVEVKREPTEQSEAVDESEEQSVGVQKDPDTKMEVDA